jgi:hypothetical protein
VQLIFLEIVYVVEDVYRTRNQAKRNECDRKFVIARYQPDLAREKRRYQDKDILYPLMRA